MFERIKRWYEQGLWSEKMVEAAEKKGVISRSEADAILGRAVV